MKNKIKLIILFAMCISGGSIYGQESANASGGDATGSGGTVAYSIGQTVYTYDSGSNGNTNKGVQQPYIISTAGIHEDVATISLITFPNPTSDYLVLEFTDYSDEKMVYQLIDLSGKIIIQNSINSSATQIDLKNYSKGTYFIKVIRDSKKN